MFSFPLLLSILFSRNLRRTWRIARIAVSHASVRFYLPRWSSLSRRLPLRITRRWPPPPTNAFGGESTQEEAVASRLLADTGVFVVIRRYAIRRSNIASQSWPSALQMKLWSTKKTVWNANRDDSASENLFNPSLMIGLIIHTNIPELAFLNQSSRCLPCRQDTRILLPSLIVIGKTPPAARTNRLKGTIRWAVWWMVYQIHPIPRRSWWKDHPCRRTPRDHLVEVMSLAIQVSRCEVLLLAAFPPIPLTARNPCLEWDRRPSLPREVTLSWARPTFRLHHEERILAKARARRRWKMF